MTLQVSNEHFKVGNSTSAIRAIDKKMPTAGEADANIVKAVAPQSAGSSSQKPSGENVGTLSADVSKLSLNPRSKSTKSPTHGTAVVAGGAATTNGVSGVSSHTQSQAYLASVDASQALKGLQQNAVANSAVVTNNDAATAKTGASTISARSGSSAPNDPSLAGRGLRIKSGGMSMPNSSSAAAPVASGLTSQPARGAEKVASDELEEDAEGEEGEEESSEISASDEDGSWISWFCSLRGNEFFCEVDEDYIQDDFNLTGLNGLVPYYDYALDMVLDVEMPMEDSLTEAQQEIVESAAEMLYGLIHARYIVTNRGMHAMYEKYRSAAFGRCPHVFCQGQPVLPVGLSDLPRNYTVNVFCPRCHGLFFPKSTRQANIDGAYFGTTFPHLYLMTHPDMVPNKPTQQYQPRIYGFKINQGSLYYRNHEEASTSRQSSSGRERSSRKKNRQSGVR